MERREFLRNAALSAGVVGVPLIGQRLFGAPSSPLAVEKKSLAGIPAFQESSTPLKAPQKSLVQTVVLVRFGGGIRRAESIDHKKSMVPFLCHGLLREGTLFSDVWIDRRMNTGHVHGSLYLSTGGFDGYPHGLFGGPFIPKRPTLSEYVRKATKGAPTDAILINNSGDISTEFIGFSDHPDYGLSVAPVNVSNWALHRRRIERHLMVATGKRRDDLMKQQAQHLKKMTREALPEHPDVFGLLDRFDREYGEKTPRGDDLVAELAVRVLQTMSPRFVQVHLQDSDFVHWGPRHLYQRGIRRMDRALHRIWSTIQHHPKRRHDTALVVVPDVGRDAHGSRRIPYQHHDPKDPESHRIWAFYAGPGIKRGKVIDHPHPQVDVAPTIGHLLGIQTPLVKGRVMEGVA